MRSFPSSRFSGLRKAPELYLGLAGQAALACAFVVPLNGQVASQDDLAKKVQVLTDAANRTQERLEESQRQLEELRRQIADIRKQMAAVSENARPTADEQRLATAVEEVKETQTVQQSQIATHEQAKVESESKYPVKVTGLILLNGFVNTRQVDMPATPTIAQPGSGSTGATLRQTVIGINGKGPRFFGAQSRADIRADFYGDAGGGDQGAAYSAAGLLRLRTAHTFLDWQHTEVFFSLDRPLVSPNEPSSLTAIAVPPLAWSGNLWTWNPQLGVSQDVPLSSFRRLRLQAALTDVADPSYDITGANATNAPPSTSERSRWPGVQARVALAGLQEGSGFQIGAGGYFTSHRTVYGGQYDSWAVTLDYRQPLPGRTQLNGTFYRGAALGGLGGGAYKDYGYRPDEDNPGVFYLRSFDAVGGWAELKERAGERLEFNEAFGTDSIPAGELRQYTGVAPAFYQSLLRTQTFTGNVIYSPSAWLLFSLEYRHLESWFVNSPSAASNIVGFAAGYKF